MANCCSASVSLFRDEAFSDEEVKLIDERLGSLSHCGGDVSYSDDGLVEWNGDMRWSIDPDQIGAVAKEFRSDVRAVGREDGVGFVQVVCANEAGTIIQNKEIGYAV